MRGSRAFLPSYLRDGNVRPMKLLALLFVLLLASCTPSFNQSIYSRTGLVGVQAECCESKLTAEQGVRDAEHDLAEREFHILRYDMPCVRTGAWQEYYANYEEFGINEQPSIFDSLEYCNAYNAVMDKALEQKFGTRYVQKRDKILPPQGAKKFEYVQK